MCLIFILIGFQGFENSQKTASGNFFFNRSGHLAVGKKNTSHDQKNGFAIKVRFGRRMFRPTETTLESPAKRIH